MGTVLTILLAAVALWMALMFCVGSWVLYLAIRDRIDQWRLRRRVDVDRLRGWSR